MTHVAIRKDNDKHTHTHTNMKWEHLKEGGREGGRERGREGGVEIVRSKVGDSKQIQGSRTNKHQKWQQTTQ